MEERPRKVARLDGTTSYPVNAEEIRQSRQAFLASLSRSVTPPLRQVSTQVEAMNPIPRNAASESQPEAPTRSNQAYIRSPFQLTHIRGLPADHNIDTVRLRDILGDPMIKECWQFNYLFDVDWLMSHFDSLARGTVQVRVVHGSWKREAPNRIAIEGACRRHPNVKAITAYLPDPFGTHHSKMMILFRHDNLAQVVIHTANMISQDWTNMSQAVWRSPLLLAGSDGGDSDTVPISPIGSGRRFKQDLLAYLSNYRDKSGEPKLTALVKQLKQYDFSTVRAALVASVPSKVRPNNRAVDAPLWGWPALKRALKHVPCNDMGGSSVVSSESESPTSHIVVQVSSIATLGKDEKYLKDTLFSALSTAKVTPTQTVSTTPRSKEPIFSIIFPTAKTVRQSLDGYGSGGSIHMKIQSTAQQSQLSYMRPYLCDWAPSNVQPASSAQNSSTSTARAALRQRAAPHVKTYIRFADTDSMNEIQWALVTSANLSTQAWGSAVASNGEVRVQSYEIGVLVWPELLIPEERTSTDRPTTNSHKTTNVASLSKTLHSKVKMIPTFGTDYPNERDSNQMHGGSDDGGRRLGSSSSQALSNDRRILLAGLRMPYDLPLLKYSRDDLPWCATMNHSEPDWMGRVYGGFEA